MQFDVSLARGQFPAVSKDWILMDNSGGTQVPFQVADSVRDYLLTTNVQHGGTYGLSREAKAAVNDGRAVAAAMLNADPGEIVFGPNMSMLFRQLAITLSELWDPDDEIIVTQGEHEANYGPWEYLESFGLKVVPWEIDQKSMSFDISKLLDLINDKTRLVAVHHGSNVLGNVMPIEKVAQLTQGTDAYLCVDGGQYVPHRLPDVKKLGADFYIYSSYKAFGPHVGVMYGKREVLEEIPGWGHFFVEDDDIPAKFELGTGNYEGAAGLRGLEKYFRAMGMDMTSPLRDVMTKVYAGIEKHEHALTRDLLGFLADQPRVHVVGEATPNFLDDRLPIVSFLVDDTDPQEFVAEVEKEKIGIRWGHFNSPRLLDALGLLEYKGVIRISMAHYTNKEELDKLKKVLTRILR